MPFVKRDANGNIEAVRHSQGEDASEEIKADDPELIEFLQEISVDGAADPDFLASDLGLARVLEDLIDLLIEKGAFRFTDLPKAAQQKLLARRGLRKEFAYVETLFSPDEDGLGPAEDSDGEGFL